MKKTYLNPTINVVEVKMQQHLLAGSGGVDTDSALGKSFNSNDVSYGRGDSDWDEY